MPFIPRGFQLFFFFCCSRAAQRFLRLTSSFHLTQGKCELRGAHLATHASPRLAKQLLHAHTISLHVKSAQTHMNAQARRRSIDLKWFENHQKDHRFMKQMHTHGIQVMEAQTLHLHCLMHKNEKPRRRQKKKAKQRPNNNSCLYSIDRTERFQGRIPS